MIGLLLAAALATEPGWRVVDPQDALVVDTTRGRVIVELRPELAPRSVERVKALARMHVYDGLLFHRVLPGRFAQTGDPDNKDGGKSSLPNLPPEFLVDDLPASAMTVVRRASDGVEGFVGSSPVAALQPTAVVPGHAGLRAWGAVCGGVLGMGRDEPRDSGNSEIFFTQTANRYLDHDYSVVGRILVGQAAIDALAPGFPPAHPDRMVTVRVLADLPAAERPRVDVMDEAGPAFAALVGKTRQARGADFTVCDVETPARVR
jgi:peptidylprolyl isomerase